MTGKIIKGIAGFYYVMCKEKIYCCKAKGIFRNKKIKPLVGDDVEFSVLNEETANGNIIDILPRHNQLIRPAVSNNDMAIVVLSITKPDPQFILLDRYLINMEICHIPVAILWNKIDLDIDDKFQEYSAIYEQAGYKSMAVSAVDGRGIDELKAFLNNKTMVFAGPSGVGKSSITNILCPKAEMITNTISTKIERGRHTTRHSELFCIGKDSYICDTPGFTAIYVDNLEPQELKSYFPEFSRYQAKCRFNGCNHLAEPECAVKDAIIKGEIPEIRYKSYVKMYRELEDKKKY